MELTKENFNSAWEFIAFVIFKFEPVNTKTKDIGRAMLLSSDPDVFIDHGNELAINTDDLKKFRKIDTIKKVHNSVYPPERDNNTPSCTFPYHLLPMMK